MAVDIPLNSIGLTLISEYYKRGSMDPLGRVRPWVNLGVWLFATLLVALLPFHVEWAKAALTTQGFEVSRAFETVTVLYIILAVTVSTLPAAVGWAFKSQVTGSSVAAGIMAGILLVGIFFLGLALGIAAYDEDLTREITLPSMYGVVMMAVLAVSIGVCFAINLAAARRGV